jgi:AraC-like DNA-binding protein
MTVPALARFVYLASLLQPRIQTVIWNTAASAIIQQRIERGKTLLAGSAWSIVEIGLALGFSRTARFGGVPKDHRTLPNRISPEPAMTPGACEMERRNAKREVTARGAASYFAEIRRFPCSRPRRNTC